MTHTSKHTLLWLTAGLLFSLLATLVVWTGLSGKAWITDPDGIPEAADSVMHCIRTGDWETLENTVTGAPALSPWTGEADSAEQIIWESYQDSLQWTCLEGFRIQEACVAQSISITCLDIAAVIRSMSAVLKDTANTVPQSQRLRVAAEQILDGQPPTAEHEITLLFRREKNRWNLVPNSDFQALLSGFTTH